MARDPKRLGVFGTILTTVLILALTAWVCITLSSGTPLIRKPDPTTVPTSGTRPTEATEATLPPPPENPYEPIDFDTNEETGEITLTFGSEIAAAEAVSLMGQKLDRPVNVTQNQVTFTADAYSLAEVKITY